MIPDFLYKRLCSFYKEEDIKRIIEGYKVNRVLSLRVNTIKASKEEVCASLKKEGLSYETTSWYSDAFFLPNTKETDIEKLSLYEEGKVYLQSLSSMLPPIFLEPKEGEQILDMAAAPGGKTTEMAALTCNKAMITAIEKNKIRAERLQYNLKKQGVKRATVLQMDARKLDSYFLFDKILLDAPCSGTGTLKMSAISSFSEELIGRSIKTQKELLHKAITHLKVGGEMVYSTCSILKEENELILTEFLQSGKIVILPLDLYAYKELPTLPSTIEGTLTICPTDFYEGFFVAKLKRIK